MNIDLSYANASTVLLPLSNKVNVALVGCGGTGSWLAPSVVRIARLLMEKFGKRVNVFFIDPDMIETKNIYRQNFCDAEVGFSKAGALAWRYGMAWGIEIKAIERAFKASENHVDAHYPTVLIGCVDRAAGRRELHEFASRHDSVWWLDCGNHQAAGQVLVGRGGLPPANPFEIPGICSWLPLPSERHQELLEDEPSAERKNHRENLSCADMAMLDSQGLAINQRIAAEASDYLVRMLLTNDLRKLATYMDLASGAARSVYVTEENVHGSQ